MKGVLFLDFDGVIRINLPGLGATRMYAESINQEDFFPPHMERVARLCRENDLKIVLSTAWNADPVESLKGHLAPYIPWDELVHEDYRTPISGCRSNEVERWLQEHDNPDYLILEDWDFNFRNATEFMRERIAWCTPKYGFTETVYKEAIVIWNKTKRS